MCNRCQELEERVAWLESELGIQQDAHRAARLAERLPQEARRHPGRQGACRLIAALYAARGRPMTRAQIMEAIPPAGGKDDERNEKIVAVWVCIARRALGRNAISNVWGRGYRLTPEGQELVRSIIEPQQAAA